MIHPTNQEPTFFSKHGKVIALGIIIVLAQVGIYLYFYGPFHTQALKEGCLSHASTIVVSDEGSLDIKETITVRTAGKLIPKGISRALANEYITSTGAPSPLRYNIFNETKRNGAPIEHTIINEEWGSKVQLFKGDAPLPPGEYTYEFHYQVFGQSKILSIGEEIKRYLTGKWLYPILHAEATIVLPPTKDPHFVKYRAYIMRQKYKKESDGTYNLLESKQFPEDIRFTRPKPNIIHLESKRPLFPGEEIVFDLLFP
ncbi:MAG: DUF2207 domain-containing protein [Bdellovibrionales bacterium]|nr:DUF2207 domain-containing protein [Bdellovibrionales bacterium]